MKRLSRLRPCEIPALLWAAFFLLCRLFPFVADDWAWGIDDRFSVFLRSFTDSSHLWHFYNNGRYFGHLFGFLFANHPWLRNLSVSFALTAGARLMADMVCADNSRKARDVFTVIAALCFLTLPPGRFGQSIAWGSSFANYGLGGVLSLLSLSLLLRVWRGEKIPWAGWYALIPLLCAFFAEHLSIGMVLVGSVSLIWSWLTRRKVERLEWIWLLSALAGLAVMFTDDGYRAVFTPGEGDYWHANVGSLSGMVRSAWIVFRGSFPNGLMSSVWVITAIQSLLMAVLTLREGGGRFYLACLQTAGCVYTLFRRLVPEWAPLGIHSALLDCAALGLYVLTLAVILLTETRGFERTRVLLGLAYTAFTALPLLAADPVTERTFFFSLLGQILLTLELLSLCRLGDSPRMLTLSLTLFFAFWGFWMSVYGTIHRYDAARVSLLKERYAAGETVSPLAKLPYPAFTAVTYPYGVWMERFLKFYDIPEGMDVTVIEFDEWRARPDFPDGPLR